MARIISIYFAGWSDKTIAQQRASQEKAGAGGRATRFRRGVQFDPLTVAGVPAEWATPADATGEAILYLHGGGYCLGSINASRDLIARLAQATRRRVLAIDYRLAPENPFPAALEDALAACDWLRQQGVAPSRLLLAGDSAGGGLAVATLIALRDADLPLPAGAICFSPWVDLALTGPSAHSGAVADPMLTASILARYAAACAGETPLTHPLLSPLYADLRGLPPLLIQVGTREILLDDAVRLARRAEEAGVSVALQKWEGLFHVFQFAPFLPESRQALALVADYCAGLAATAA
jgi:acetyl esterase/lipase